MKYVVHQKPYILSKNEIFFLRKKVLSPNKKISENEKCSTLALVNYHLQKNITLINTIFRKKKDERYTKRNM